MTTPTEIFLVLSALGPDRPGLVAEITEYLTKRGANVEDSRMAVLGGEFGVLVLVSGAPEEVAAVERDRAVSPRRQGSSCCSAAPRAPRSTAAPRACPAW